MGELSSAILEELILTLFLLTAPTQRQHRWTIADADSTLQCSRVTPSANESRLPSAVDNRRAAAMRISDRSVMAIERMARRKATAATHRAAPMTRAQSMTASGIAYRRMNQPRMALGEHFAACDAITRIDLRIASSDYPPITSVEQRRKYKTEFDKDYAEYRQLHLIMDKARRRFAHLHQELNNVSPSERKYQVSVKANVWPALSLLTNLLFLALSGDSESNHSRIQGEQQQHELQRQEAEVRIGEVIRRVQIHIKLSFF